MKICIDCNKTKDESEYGKHATTKDGLMQRCKACVSIYNKQYRKNNKERIVALNKDYYIREAEKIKERSNTWRINNPERKQAYNKKRYQKFKDQGRIQEYYGNVDKERNKQKTKIWRQMNPGRVNASIAKRRAEMLRATPPWAEYDQIVEIYKEARWLTETTGIEHQVDHIVPLKSNIVCGLHCIANLQIFTAKENNTKKCKFQDNK